MEFRFGHLADYAGEGAAGKLIAVGIFENVHASSARPVMLPIMHLVAVFEAFVAEGTEHQLEVRFTNADGVAQFPPAPVPINFVPQGPNRPLRANVIIQLAGLQVPDVGDYAFNLFIDTHFQGRIPIVIIPMPQARAGQQGVGRG